MAMDILDSTTASAFAAAASQQAQCEALIAAWAGGNVTAKIYSNTTLRETLTLNPFTIDTVASPREVVCGSVIARTHVSAGSITKVVFSSSGTDIFAVDAGAGTGSIAFVGAIKELCAPNLNAVTFTSDPLLPTMLVPSWAEIDSGMWAEIPMGGTLDAVDPIDNAAINPNYPSAPEWSLTVNRQANVVAAWCGAAYDDTTDKMWLGLGGGHSDYAGNEVYKCDFLSDTPTWELVRNPSGAIGNLLTTNDGQEASGLYSDGRPRATHGYNKWTYVPNVGAVMVAHGSASWTASNGKRWTIFLDSSGEASFTSEPTSFSLNGSDGLAACYDSSRNAIWFVPGGTEEVHRYDIPGSGGAHTGSFTTVGSAAARSGYISIGYMPTEDVLLIGNSNDGKSTSGWEVFDCATGTRYTPTFSGSAAIEAHTNGRCALRWVESLGAFCTWNNAANTTLITRLTPGANPRTDTWTIDTLPVNPSNTVTPSVCTTLGTYGRFVYSSTFGGFIVFNSTTGATYFYKV